MFFLVCVFPPQSAKVSSIHPQGCSIFVRGEFLLSAPPDVISFNRIQNSDGYSASIKWLSMCLDASQFLDFYTWFTLSGCVTTCYVFAHGSRSIILTKTHAHFSRYVSPDTLEHNLGPGMIHYSLQEKSRFCEWSRYVENNLNSSGPSNPVRGATDSFASCPCIWSPTLLHPLSFSLHECGHLFHACVVFPSEQTKFSGVLILTTTLCLWAKSFQRTLKSDAHVQTRLSLTWILSHSTIKVLFPSVVLENEIKSHSNLRQQHVSSGNKKKRRKKCPLETLWLRCGLCLF